MRGKFLVKTSRASRLSAAAAEECAKFFRYRRFYCKESIRATVSSPRPIVRSVAAVSSRRLVD